MTTWRCPGCKGDNLRVTITTMARLWQYPEEDNFETEVDGDHEWDDDSTMRCIDCGYADKSAKFKQES